MTQQPVDPRGTPTWPPGSNPTQPGHREPTQPFGHRPPPPVSITNFAPPRTRTPLLVTIGALTVLVLAMASGFVPLPWTDPATVPTRSAQPSSTRALPGQPFNAPQGLGSGRWQLHTYQWTSQGLLAEIEVTCDKGNVDFQLMAFENRGTDVVDPADSPRRPELTSGSLRAGSSARGFAFFPMNRQDATIILATDSGSPMSALAVKASLTGR